MRRRGEARLQPAKPLRPDFVGCTLNGELYGDLSTQERRVGVEPHPSHNADALRDPAHWRLVSDGRDLLADPRIRLKPTTAQSKEQSGLLLPIFLVTVEALLALSAADPKK